MEGYAFALMANSGTDPDLEAEDELNERLAEAGEIKKASHVKGENQQEDEEEKLSAVSSVERLIEMANAKLLMSEEHALQDHHAAVWPYDETLDQDRMDPIPVASRKSSFRTVELASIAESSRESLKSPEEQPSLPDAAPSYIVRSSNDHQTWEGERCHFRPAHFEISSTARNYTPIPPLKLALPSVPHLPLPMHSTRNRRLRRRDLPASVLQQQQKSLIHSLCSKAPLHPVLGLYSQSNEVLRKHYESLRIKCYFKMHELEKENTL